VFGSIPPLYPAKQKINNTPLTPPLLQHNSLLKLYFHLNLHFGENIMAKNSCGKRPCSICRKWFQPNVRKKNVKKHVVALTAAGP